MDNNKIVTAEHAFMVEVMGDMTKLLNRAEAIGNALEDKMRKATEDGMSKAAMSMNFRFEELIAKNEARLVQASNKAASQMDSRLEQKIASMTTASKESLRRCWSLLLTIATTSLCSAIIGGIIVHYLERR